MHTQASWTLSIVVPRCKSTGCRVDRVHRVKSCATELPSTNRLTSSTFTVEGPPFGNIDASRRSIEFILRV